MAQKHGGLGKGLDALIGRGRPEAEPEHKASQSSSGDKIPIDRIRAGVWQPRRGFDPGALAELEQSIREHGVLQPLLVRVAGDGYELIAGERRYRAAQAAGLTEIPARVIVADDQTAAELALIENLQREDLDPIEEAEGYAALADRFNLSQEQISERVGKARASVANALRILGLPGEIRDLVRAGSLSAGHAKVLLSWPTEAERLALGRRCAREGWSVRELERKLARAGRVARKGARSRATASSPHLASLEDRLRERFGTAVEIEPCRLLPSGRKGRGRIAIDFYSDDDLDRLLVLLGVTDDGI
ncbi:MAG: ParB/RepB/Spo0J family partition protein [Kiritimatiellia bacterium]|nr:ParB/RepB/Spo0J family partition protein [Kiritimatiellia bacterium]